jgi:DNA-binding transcriptional LysR family regulator
MHTDLNLLKVFVVVATAENFRVAADRLGVSRSAVSQAIRRLEDELGSSLVQRTTRSVRLTEAGEPATAGRRPPGRSAGRPGRR